MLYRYIHTHTHQDISVLPYGYFIWSIFSTHTYTSRGTYVYTRWQGRASAAAVVGVNHARGILACARCPRESCLYRERARELSVALGTPTNRHSLARRRPSFSSRGIARARTRVYTFCTRHTHGTTSSCAG